VRYELTVIYRNVDDSERLLYVEQTSTPTGVIEAAWDVLRRGLYIRGDVVAGVVTRGTFIPAHKIDSVDWAILPAPVEQAVQS
jgi:hypothetical protein